MSSDVLEDIPTRLPDSHRTYTYRTLGYGDFTHFHAYTHAKRLYLIISECFFLSFLRRVLLRPSALFASSPSACLFPICLLLLPSTSTSPAIPVCFSAHSCQPTNHEADAPLQIYIPLRPRGRASRAELGLKGVRDFTLRAVQVKWNTSRMLQSRVRRQHILNTGRVQIQVYRKHVCSRVPVSQKVED